MTKQWVFIELVKDEKDIEGLISYAIYKYRKNELALDAKKKGKSEEEIDLAVRAYHDQVLASKSTQDDFREKAVRILDVAIQKSSQAIVEKQNKAYDNKLQELERKEKELELREKQLDKILAKERLKVRNEEINRIKEAAKNTTKDSRRVSFAKWLASGFSGILATTIAVIFAFGLMSITSSEEKKQELMAETIKKLVTLYSSTPIN
ncbi:hypothetical protein RZT97_003433 [Vibrio cholerae]|nr:hypothetical protein [Vibrio cholerae]